MKDVDRHEIGYGTYTPRRNTTAKYPVTIAARRMRNVMQPMPKRKMGATTSCGMAREGAGEGEGEGRGWEGEVGILFMVIIMH